MDEFQKELGTIQEKAKAYDALWERYVELFKENTNLNKGKTMNEATLSVEDFQKAKDILRNNAIKYDEQGNLIVPVNSSATMEFQTETVKNEG